MTSMAPPDGGLRAWLIVVASFLCNGLIFGLLNSFNVIYEELRDELAQSQDQSPSSKASLVGSLAMGMTFMFSIVAGILVDIAGIRTTALIGGALATIGMFLSSFFVTNVIALWLTYGVLLGLGASLAYTPSLVILGHYFDKHMGMVNGIVCMGSSVFTIFMPFLLKALLKSLGLKYTFMCLAVMMLFVMMCALIFKPLHGPKTEPISGKKKSFINKFINFEIWKEPKYVIWAGTIPFTLLGYLVPYVHGATYLTELFPDEDGKFVILCIGISSGIGRLVFGLIADSPIIDRILLQQISFVMIGALTMMITVAPSFLMFITIVFCMGLFDGCFITLLGPIAYDLCGKAGAGQAIGCLLALCSIPVTIGPPIAGLLYDSLGSYRLPFLLSGIPTIIGGLVLSLVRCVGRNDNDKGKLNDVHMTESGSSEENFERETLVERPAKATIVKSARV